MKDQQLVLNYWNIRVGYNLVFVLKKELTAINFVFLDLWISCTLLISQSTNLYHILQKTFTCKIV